MTAMWELLFSVLGLLMGVAVSVMLAFVLPTLPDYAYVVIGFCAGFIGTTAGQCVARKRRA